MKELRVIKDSGEGCFNCCLDLTCMDHRDQGTQIVMGKIFNCIDDNIIYKYDEVLELKVTEPESINFYIGSDVCGTLYKEDGIMKFKGDLDKSAKALFDYVCKIWNEDNK